MKHNKKNIKLKKYIIFIFLLILTVFSELKSIKNKDFLTQKNIYFIKYNNITEKNLLNLLGKPTAKSIFGKKIYFYIEKKHTQFKLIQVKLKKRDIIAFEFDSNNIIKKIIVYNNKNYNSIKYDLDLINLKRNKMKILKQIFGNIGNFNTPALK